MRIELCSWVVGFGVCEMCDRNCLLGFGLGFMPQVTAGGEDERVLVREQRGGLGMEP